MYIREKIIVLIQNSVGGCSLLLAEKIADYLIENGVTILPEGAIILTKEEIARLNEYQKRHFAGGEQLEEVPQQ